MGSFCACDRKQPNDVDDLPTSPLDEEIGFPEGELQYDGMSETSESSKAPCHVETVNGNEVQNDGILSPDVIYDGQNTPSENANGQVSTAQCESMGSGNVNGQTVTAQPEAMASVDANGQASASQPEVMSSDNVNGQVSTPQPELFARDFEIWD